MEKGAEMLKPKKRVDWPDLSAHGLRLVVSELPSKQRLLVLQGADKVPESAARLGFHRLEQSGQWVRENLKFSLAPLQREFPRVRILQMDSSEILRLGRRTDPGVSTGPARQEGAQQPMPPQAALMQAKSLGLNFDGASVWEGATGRFIRLGNAVIPETGSTLSPASFLRATDAENFNLCADGFVNQIAAGRRMQSRDLLDFAETIHGEPITIADIRLRATQEAVEAAMVRRLASEASAPDRSAFDIAVRLYEGQPVLKSRTSGSIALQQFSTPLPMSVIAQRLLGDAEDLRGKTILEPTIGNGSLVSLLPHSVIIGRDLDARRLDQTANLLASDQRQIDLSVADATEGALPAAQFSIVNPPFGRIDMPLAMHGLRVTRVDHQILMKALESRDAKGRTVAIIAGDNPMRTKPGQVTGGSKNLTNWLADHYQIEGVVEADGGLYARQGAEYPIRIFVIGDRRETPGKGLAQSVIPERLEVVRDYESLWDWASGVVAARAATNIIPAAKVPQSTDADENDWQAPYTPQSVLGEATAMIPRNLVGPTRKALARIAAEHGNIDEWVAGELQWTVEELGQRLAPEQIDAVALDFYATDHGRAIIEADQTGLGKGRVLACAARRAALKGLPVILNTEKPNLFSDFWRDLQDIGSTDIFTPMILNEGVPIRDTVTGEILVSATAPAQVRRALQEGDFVPGTNLAFCTYTQFSREGAKVEWLRSVSVGSRLICEESHNAAGDSFTAEVMAEAVQNADEVIYSSATYAKGAKNMAAYSRAFPLGTDMENLAETIAAGGEPLQEVLSAMLAEDGVLVRREHDLSRVEFQVLLDEERQQRNRDVCDALAPILAGMAYLGGDVARIVSAMNKENKKALEKVPEADRQGARLHVSSMEFGSRLYQLNRLFIMALETDQAKEIALHRLGLGEKPVLFVENTMESLLKEVINDIRLEDDQDPLDELPTDLAIDLQFRDLLSRTLTRMMVITERTGYGMVAKRAIDDPETLAAFGRIRALIEQFPDLPVSPIDEIRKALETEGYSANEITGRSLQVVDGKAVNRPNEDRNTIISRFNGGHTDALTISGAGSTGLSLHSGRRFPDQRRRALIELQIANNVAQRVQTWGRVNRKDQVNTPIILTPNTVLPAQARLMAMQNEKLRKLSANVTSNRNNAAEDKTVPDILNWVGDTVCRRMLTARPDLAFRLCIDLPDEKDQERNPDDLFYVNKLLGRLTLLKSAEQEEVYQEIATEFRCVMEDFEAKGMNPFKARELDGTWEVKSRIVFDGAEEAGRISVFRAPVYLTMIEGTRDIKPLRSDALAEMVAHGKERLAQSRNAKDADEAIWSCIAIIDKKRPQLLAAVLPRDIDSVAAALSAKDDNPVKDRAKSLEQMALALDSVRVGGAITSDRK